MAHSAKAFTKDKLHKMEASGGVPHNLDRDRDAESDNYGMTAAGSSSSAQFKRGGMAHGEAKKPHMGRARRATGGRTGPERDMNKASTDVTHFGDDVKLPIPEKNRGGRTKRFSGGPGTPSPTPYIPRGPNPSFRPGPSREEELDAERASRAGERAVSDELNKNRGGRTHNAEHRHHRASGGPAGRDDRPQASNVPEAAKRSQETGVQREMLHDNKLLWNKGGRVNRAHGGRAGKGKTVVNVIVGGGRGQQPQGPMPAPMAPPMPPPMPPAPPPHPPMMPPPGGMPPGMPPGAGAPPMPPPGGMPMRARGGKIPGPAVGGNGGLGRLEKAKEEGARY